MFPLWVRSIDLSVAYNLARSDCVRTYGWGGEYPLQHLLFIWTTKVNFQQNIQVQHFSKASLSQMLPIQAAIAAIC